MFAMPVDQDGCENRHADPQRHGETDADFEKFGRSAGDLVCGMVVEQLNRVERGFCERVV